MKIINVIALLILITSTVHAQSSKEFTTKGFQFIENSRWEESIIEFNNAIKLNPNNQQAYLGRGQAKLVLQKESAIQDINKSIELDPTDVFAYLYRGMAKSSLKKDYKGAIDDYSKVLEMVPNNQGQSQLIKSSALHKRGDAKKMLEDYHGALLDLNDAISFDSTDWSSWTSRAEVKMEISDYKGAISDYTKAIKLNPDDFYLYDSRASAKNSIDDYEGAITDYSKAIILTKQNGDKELLVDLYNFRGVAYLKINNYRKAVDDFNESNKLDPEFQTALINRADAYINLGNTSMANKDLDKAIKLNPVYGLPYLLRGNIKSKKKNYDGAIKDYNKAIGYYSKMMKESYIFDDYFAEELGAVYIARGITYEKQKKLSLAEDDYDKAIELMPNLYEIRISRALVRLQNKDYKHAIEDYDYVISQNLEDRESYLGRGVAKIKLGKTEDGCKDLKISKKLGSESATDIINKYCN